MQLSIIIKLAPRLRQVMSEGHLEHDLVQVSAARCAALPMHVQRGSSYHFRLWPRLLITNLQDDQQIQDGHNLQHPQAP